MKVSDKDSDNNVYDNEIEAVDEANKQGGYAIASFKINGQTFFMVTYE